jgi:cell division protein FtsW
MGIQFQPSEFGKMACIVFVAFMLSKQERFSPDRRFWIILISVSITCLLILSENFSTAVLLFVVCFLMMFVGQMPMKKMLLLLLVLTFSAGFVFFTLRSISDEFIEAHCPAQLQTRVLTIKGRVDDFGKDKGENKYTITDDNFQVSHAKIAIARGSILGKLPGRSVQRDFLPQAYSDFIYAIIIEEMGLIVGGVGVMMLYVILMIRVANIARRCKKLFPKYLALGCGLLIVVQAFINMAVAVNLIPVTGQPLPLISRGGTSTMLTCFYFGIILSVSRFGAGMGEEEDDEEEEIMDNDENDEPVESDENDENGVLLKSNDDNDELVVTDDFIVIDEKDENDEEI